MLYNENKNKFLSLLSFSGNYKLLTMLGCILSVFSAICQLMPFVYIWKFIDALFSAFPNFSAAQNLEGYALMAFIFAISAIALNFCSLMCTHLSAFRNERNMKIYTMKHLFKIVFRLFF